MILLIHISVALAGMAAAAFALIAPSNTKLTISYSLAAATLATGIYLVTQNPGRLVQACIVGLVYFAAVGIVTAFAHAKLVRQDI